MQDIRLEDNGRLLRLKVETEEDLWALYASIRPGDIVSSRTSRELRNEGESRRKSMTLGVRVKDVEYQPFTDRLRVRGIIVSSPKELDLEGQHHTLSIEPGMDVAIRREGRWKADDLERLRRMARGAAARALAIALDDEEFAIALLRGNGVQLLEEGNFGLPGKDQPDERELRYGEALAGLAGDLERTARELGVKYLIVAGPAHWKNDLISRLRRLEAGGVQIFVDSSSYGGIKGIYEVLRRDVVKDILRRAILVEELGIMDRVNSIMAGDPDLVAYTLDGVEGAVQEGAAEEVIVDSDLLRSQDEALGQRALEVLDRARQTKARVTILESKHPELRVWISSFGGILAVLRYKNKNKKQSQI